MKTKIYFVIIGIALVILAFIFIKSVTLSFILCAAGGLTTLEALYEIVEEKLLW